MKKVLSFLLVLLVIISLAILSLLVLSFIKRPKGFEGMDGIITEMKRELEGLEKSFKASFENQLTVYKQFNELLSSTVSNYNKEVVNYNNTVLQMEDKYTAILDLTDLKTTLENMLFLC